jgi:hypothetical protein
VVPFVAPILIGLGGQSTLNGMYAIHAIGRHPRAAPATADRPVAPAGD